MIVILAICMIANAAQTDVSGKWDMVALYNYRFDLDIKQSGDQILGTMTRTNGDEPVDKVQGTVSSDGTIKFDRDRPGQWVQHYTGQISSSGDSLTMGGDYAHALTGSVSAGVTSGPWTATKTDESELAGAGVPPELGVNPSAYITEYDQDSYAPPAEPTTVEGWNAKGLDLYNQGKYDEAIQAFDKALNLNNWDAASFYNKGIALEAKGENGEARRFLYRALDLGYPDNGLSARLAAQAKELENKGKS